MLFAMLCSFLGVFLFVLELVGTVYGSKVVVILSEIVFEVENANVLHLIQNYHNPCLL